MMKYYFTICDSKDYKKTRGYSSPTAMYVSQKKKVKIIIVNVILNQAMFHESQSVKLTKDI